jgi:hypothetical protein
MEGLGVIGPGPRRPLGGSATAATLLLRLPAQSGLESCAMFLLRFFRPEP